MNNELMNYLKEISLNKHPVYVWGMNDDHITKAQVRLKRIDINGETLSFSFDEQSLLYLNDIVHAMAPVNLYCEKLGLLFSAKFTEMNGDMLKTTLPEYHKVVDKRGAERIAPLIPLNIKFRFDRVINNSCFDISEGGISVVISSLDRKFFTEGQELKNIEIKFLLSSHKVTGRVAGMRKIKPYELEGVPHGGFRVSIQLLKASDQYKFEVSKIVSGQRKLMGDLDL